MDTLSFADAFRTAAILSAFSHASAQGDYDMPSREAGHAWLPIDPRMGLVRAQRRCAALRQALVALMRRRRTCEIPGGAARWTPAFAAVIGPVNTDRTRRLLSHFAFYDEIENRTHQS